MMSECCNGIEKKEKVVNVEYLYLDLNTCERCVGTDKVLEDVLKSLERYFKIAGYTVKYSKVEIETEKNFIKNNYFSIFASFTKFFWSRKRIFDHFAKSFESGKVKIFANCFDVWKYDFHKLSVLLKC